MMTSYIKDTNMLVKMYHTGSSFRHFCVFSRLYSEGRVYICTYVVLSKLHSSKLHILVINQLEMSCVAFSNVVCSCY